MSGLNNKYTLVQLVYNRISENHIPYVAGALVKGPRGGYIMLDEFTIEVALKQIGIIDWSRRPLDIIDRKQVRYVMVKEYKTDQLVNKVADIYEKSTFKHIKVVKRDLETGIKIGKNLEIAWK